MKLTLYLRINKSNKRCKKHIKIYFKSINKYLKTRYIMLMDVNIQYY